MKHRVTAVLSTWMYTYLFIQCNFAACLSQPDIIYSKVCLSPLCSECSTDIAVCETNDPQEVIPQNVTKYRLHITYTNANNTVVLTQSHFKTYHHLKELELSGDIEGITDDAFHKMSKLRSVRIIDTKISFIPDSIFKEKANFKSLELSGNSFTSIPTNINLPDSQIENFFFGNTIVKLPCSNGYPVLPSELAKWKSMQNLTLERLEVDFEASNCTFKTIGNNFFNSVSQVSSLQLRGSKIFDGDQTLMKSLKRLSVLVLDSTSPYKECPSSAVLLFANLNVGLTRLSLNYWNINGTSTNESCLLTESSLSKLPTTLHSMSVRYSEHIFGSTLARGVIPNYLSYLDLGYCGLTTIQDGAIGDVLTLNLDGNMVNPNSVKIYSKSKRKPVHLSTMSLRSINAVSDSTEVLNFYPLMSWFQELSDLDLSRNSLQNLPLFWRNVTNMHETPYPSKLETLTLDDNFLRALLSSDQLCTMVPELKTLSIANNLLEDISGLNRCYQLQNLQLQKNYIGYGLSRKINRIVLKSLVGLTLLDLSHNFIKILDNDIFHGMHHLRYLNLAANEIYHLDTDIFSSNIMVMEIDLSWNSLATFTQNMVKTLSSLELLRLNGNLIAGLDQTFLTYVDSHISESYRLYLADNSIDCSCDRKYFQTWLQTTHRVLDKGFLRCSTVHPEQFVVSYVDDYFDCTVKPILIPLGSALGGIIVVILLALPCYKYRWYIKHSKMVLTALVSQLEQVKFEERCEYDAYVSYNRASAADSAWVVDKLLPALESLENVSASSMENQGFKFFLQDRNTVIGSSTFSVRCETFEICRKIIIVASNSYITSCDCLSEAELAGKLMNGSETYLPNRVFVIVRESLSEEYVRPPISALLLENVLHLPVDNTNIKEMDRIWSRIRKFLEKPQIDFQRRKSAENGNNQISRSASRESLLRNGCTDIEHDGN